MKNYLLDRNNLENINTMISYTVEAMQENTPCDYDERLHNAFIQFENELQIKITDKITREKIISEFFIMVGNYEELCFEMGFKIGLKNYK